MFNLVRLCVYSAVREKMGCQMATLNPGILNLEELLESGAFWGGGSTNSSEGQQPQL